MIERMHETFARMGSRSAQAMAHFTAFPGDTEEMHAQKSLSAGGTFFILPVTLVWGSAYLMYGETTAALITFGYTLICLFGLAHMRRTGSLQVHALLQLSATLLLPFALTLVLGGFTSSSAIILGAFMAPLGTMLYYQQTSPPAWLAGYIGVLALAGLLDPFVRRSNGLPELLILTFFVLNAIVNSIFIFLVLRTSLQQREQATALLQLEQEKSERLLLNVLPASIAAILKDDNRTIADRFETVTVLFADVVGSTPLAEELDPVQMVDLLNEVFNYFDSLVEAAGLEKVRTMGDSYMIVSGAPQPRPDHAQALAQVALEMLAFAEHAQSPLISRLQFRIGMNCGPVIAGIIGHTKFHYDVWGDTVNVASRMESHGEAGRIQITRPLYELLREEFNCEPRGWIEIKGKGAMETWYVTGPRIAAA